MEDLKRLIHSVINIYRYWYYNNNSIADVDNNLSRYTTHSVESFFGESATFNN